ncbi:sulfatase [Haloterrigena salifodinae]|uniref:Sulfatase n=1 Tax=Haloterrigena salifodinae TaxID=2675099 RepID=A0A8T8DXQ5_9EURY|nr:sulfatase [Haloterrigena salifodinae]QRV13993.1 sulfatase [Haloterrigena salifodinae]
MTSDPNVLLVVLDSVRARNTSLHDHDHDTTPALVSLAEQATTYTQARAPDRWSLPSHASLFTGLTPPEHGITQKGDSLLPGNSVFANLNSDGYATGVFSGNPFLTQIDTGLRDGFETVEGASTGPLYPTAVDPHDFEGDVSGFLRAAIRNRQPVRSFLNGVTTKLAWDYPEILPDKFLQEISGGVSRDHRYTDLFLKWEKRQTGPWAACINYMDAHHPYSPRDEHNHWADSSIEEVLDEVSPYPGNFYTRSDLMWRCEVAEFLYDGAIRQVDHEVNRLVETLKQRGVFEETLIVITGDHGEGFGDLSRLRPLRIAGHAVGGHESNLHVPLVVKYPEQHRSECISEPVSLTQFPDAVHAVRDESRDSYTKPFVSDDPVVSVGSEADAEHIGRLQDEDIATAVFEEDVEIVYESAEDGTVLKHMRWKDEVATVRVIDTHTVVSTDQYNAETIDSTFDSLADQDVAERNSGMAVGEATMERLDQLGYR